MWDLKRSGRQSCPYFARGALIALIIMFVSVICAFGMFLSRRSLDYFRNYRFFVRVSTSFEPL